MKPLTIGLCIVLGLVTLTTAQANPAPGVTASPAASSSAASPPELPMRNRNGVLVDEKGRGIYTYDLDKVPGQSDCNGQCIILWPPLRAADDAQPRGAFTIIQRKDGTRQWALRGKPLYRWISDKKRGDMGGDGVSGVWRLVRVAAPKPVSTDAPTPTAPTTERKP